MASAGYHPKAVFLPARGSDPASVRAWIQLTVGMLNSEHLEIAREIQGYTGLSIGADEDLVVWSGKVVGTLNDAYLRLGRLVATFRPTAVFQTFSPKDDPVSWTGSVSSKLNSLHTDLARGVAGGS